MEDGATGSDRGPGLDQGDATDRPESASAPAATSEMIGRELERARERIAFYESFDRLIQDNIARSGDLLRAAAEQREEAAREVAAMRDQLDRRMADQRATLALLSNELLGLQEQLAGLAGRVSAALDDLGPAEQQPASDTGSRPADAEPAADAPPATDAAATMPDAGATGADPDGGGGTDDGRPAARPLELVVHGVPRAAAALSLQRHLNELAYVEAVEAREYAAGVLRLQVVAHAPLALDDLRRWEGGEGLEPVTVLADVIEIKLPGAAGF